MYPTHPSVEHDVLRPPFELPPSLSFLRLRISLRLLQDTWLPSYKGSMLRGAFGYAMKHSSCLSSCWAKEDGCSLATLCSYRWIFETPHPPHVEHLRNLRDVPRPFVIEPPLDERTRYAAGDPLEFGLVLIGRGVDHIPTFIASFEELGKLGIGHERARVRLERVEALQPWQPVGVPIYQDGRVAVSAAPLPVLEPSALLQRAHALPSDVRVTLRTPLRVKRPQLIVEHPPHGAPRERTRRADEWIDDIDADTLGTIVRSITWRLDALAAFHGAGPWAVDHRALVEQARSIMITDKHLRWRDLERTSSRASQRGPMPLGGLVGSFVLRDVPVALRAVLLAGSLIHVGKACVFGHGGFDVQPVAAR